MLCSFSIIKSWIAFNTTVNTHCEAIWAGQLQIAVHWESDARVFGWVCAHMTNQQLIFSYIHWKLAHICVNKHFHSWNKMTSERSRLTDSQHLSSIMKVVWTHNFEPYINKLSINIRLQVSGKFSDWKWDVTIVIDCIISFRFSLDLGLHLTLIYSWFYGTVLCF